VKWKILKGLKGSMWFADHWQILEHPTHTDYPFILKDTNTMKYISVHKTLASAKHCADQKFYRYEEPTKAVQDRIDFWLG
jgi:hypothetical protein